ncbi:flagellar hook-associated protein FlgK [Blastopirellula marina]|uniref:Flagellar hook-associated protein 1 n=1 Tax=Blastopirellula marina TaxID=124 RepID=A0A2S8FT81_9BACT|nr:flagellar hook-associated protein FlgK [Blastopirellula marina]PQO35392.1 flagellar hook-associated protein FlgK [Blastopirellula marina]PQO41439.1 flagellar hook-associated protein FlgK [Blastopirellula marina]PTL44032.1 flagellar hook-associated protein FlgK [Blastopirellula marina]
MTLYTSLQQTKNALLAAQIGIQVTGNNIANVNTPDYLRERVIYTPAPTQSYGNLRLGMGVQVEGVVQHVDQFLEERLRNSISDLSNGETQENVYLQLEALVGELSNTDISTSLNDFLGSINDILNQPEDVGVRNLSVLKGQTLAGDISRLYDRAKEIHDDLNKQIKQSADDINSLLNDIADLNVKITNLEAGPITKSDAIGLRDQRQRKLTQLAEIIDIKGVEQENGSVSVFLGGEYLVVDGIARQVETKTVAENGLNNVKLTLAGTDSPIQANSGKLAGLITSRDSIVGDFLGNLDDFSQTLIYEFNRVFSSGQGESGYQSMTSEFFVDESSVNKPLDEAGLTYTPVNGSFKVYTLNTQTGLTTTANIPVKLNGLSDDTSLQDIADAISAVDGLTASISLDGHLQIESDSQNIEFAFGNDTSGALAALGMGTFFTGTSASTIGIQAAVKTDPSKFAASKNGIGADTDNAVDLASFLDRPLDSKNGKTIDDVYTQLVGEVTQSASVAKSVAEGYRVFKETLDGQKQGLSGVSLDEEAVNLITYQRQFQAASRLISVIDDLLETLVNL